MSGLSQEQIEKRASIQKSALTFGIIAGVIVGLIALWVLSGQGGTVRYGGAIVIGAVVGFLVRNASFKSGAKSAACEKCGAAFSISRSDRSETPAGSEPKEEREPQDDGTIKVTTWTEDSFDVVDTYTCASCGDASTKAYTTTKRRDEAERIERVKGGGAKPDVDPPEPEATPKAEGDAKKPEPAAPPTGGKKKGGGGKKGSS